MPAAAADDTVAVCAAVDAAYLPLMLVVATSIADSAAPGRRVDLHILYDGPDSWAVRRLTAWRHPTVEIVLHRLANPYAHFGTISGFPPSTLFRYAIPEVLAHLDRVIYLDGDLIVEADLGELFHAPLDGRPIGAVVDIGVVDEALTSQPHRQQRHQRMFNHLHKDLGYDTPEAMLTYIQAGVTLLDLKQLRQLGYAARMAETTTRLHGLLYYADQCATNAAFRNNIAILDPRWNVAPEALWDGLWDEVIPQLRPAIAAQRRDPRIIHFAYRKPWRRLGLPGGNRWWRHARRAGVAGYYAVQFVRYRLDVELKALGERLTGRRPWRRPRTTG